MKWVVAIPCIPKTFLSSPSEFLSIPESRARPIWACGVVDAVEQDDAYDKAFDAWKRGQLEGPTPPNYWPINSYVAPLNEAAKRADQCGLTTSSDDEPHRPWVCSPHREDERRDWVAAVAWISPDFLANPKQFLENPTSRI